jgi:hypothetical protein
MPFQKKNEKEKMSAYTFVRMTEAEKKCAKELARRMGKSEAEWWRLGRTKDLKRGLPKR